MEIAQNPIMSGLRKAGNKRVELSGIGGIETWRDALEFIQLGCNNVQVCTAVMQYGYRIIDDLILGLQRYMAKRGVAHLAELVGEELPNFVTPTDLDLAVVMCRVWMVVIRPSSSMPPPVSLVSLARSAWVVTSAVWYVPQAPSPPRSASPRKIHSVKALLSKTRLTTEIVSLVLYL